MAHVVLVHGASHGAWCWDDVVPVLTGLGHMVTALDLSRPPDGSADAYLSAILAALSDRTVLVGHSLGGMWITAAAGLAPGRIARLVYVAAWVPRDGQSARELAREAGAHALRGALRRTTDGAATEFTEAATDLLYHDCPAGTPDRAIPRLVPEPLAPQNQPLHIAANAVPRSYVLCRNDRLIPPHIQARMCEGWDDVHTLACGHSPFFAMPDRLARVLDRVASAPA